jgi:hypothetical protein
MSAVMKMIPSRCRRALLFSVTVVAAFIAAGCGGGPNTPYPVRGTVFLDGEPATELAGWTVVFSSGELHKGASGVIKEDGTYSLGSSSANDGAIPGKYEVTVSPPDTEGQRERVKKRPAVKAAPFAQPKNLVVTVEMQTNDIPIKLQRKK